MRSGHKPEMVVVRVDIGGTSVAGQRSDTVVNVVVDMISSPCGQMFDQTAFASGSGW